MNNLSLIIICHLVWLLLSTFFYLFLRSDIEYSLYKKIKVYSSFITNAGLVTFNTISYFIQGTQKIETLFFDFSIYNIDFSFGLYITIQSFLFYMVFVIVLLLVDFQNYMTAKNDLSKDINPSVFFTFVVFLSFSHSLVQILLLLFIVDLCFISIYVREQINETNTISNYSLELIITQVLGTILLLFGFLLVIITFGTSVIAEMEIIFQDGLKDVNLVPHYVLILLGITLKTAFPPFQSWYINRLSLCSTMHISSVYLCLPIVCTILTPIYTLFTHYFLPTRIISGVILIITLMSTGFMNDKLSIGKNLQVAYLAFALFSLSFNLKSIFNHVLLVAPLIFSSLWINQFIWSKYSLKKKDKQLGKKWLVLLCYFIVSTSLIGFPPLNSSALLFTYILNSFYVGTKTYAIIIYVIKTIFELIILIKLFYLFEEINYDLLSIEEIFLLLCCILLLLVQSLLYPLYGLVKIDTLPMSINIRSLLNTLILLLGIIVLILSSSGFFIRRINKMDEIKKKIVLIGNKLIDIMSFPFLIVTCFYCYNKVLLPSGHYLKNKLWKQFIWKKIILSSLNNIFLLFKKANHFIRTKIYPTIKQSLITLSCFFRNLETITFQKQLIILICCIITFFVILLFMGVS